jgi:hypothetical protein
LSFCTRRWLKPSLDKEKIAQSMTDHSSPDTTVNENRKALLFANFAHFFSHVMMLVYPTVVIVLEVVFDRPYGELLSLSFVGFVLYGVAALPAGWLGDRWSAQAMLAVFFFLVLAPQGSRRDALQVPSALLLRSAVSAYFLRFIILSAPLGWLQMRQGNHAEKRLASTECLELWASPVHL